QSSDFPYLMLVTVGITTVAWLAVTLLTPAEPREKLIHFYRKVKPEGPGWRRIAAEAGAGRSDAGGGLTAQVASWFLGCVFIYASLLGIGKLGFKESRAAVLFVVVAVAAAALFSGSLS